ncbi:MAG TPA: hypothetical protein VHG91_19935 [Longimicrobium sp.]|nr:hypothetical protein [Longimicrobium sp.]
MAAPGGSAPWDAVREAVQRELGHTSLRALAKRIGLPAPTLHNFLNAGVVPHRRTAEKLRAWHGTVAGVSADEARAAFAALTPGLKKRSREEAFQAFRALVAAAYRRDRAPVPAWTEDPPAGDGA